MNEARFGKTSLPEIQGPRIHPRRKCHPKSWVGADRNPISRGKTNAFPTCGQFGEACEPMAEK